MVGLGKVVVIVDMEESPVPDTVYHPDHSTISRPIIHCAPVVNKTSVA
jgi:hypothetical protein